MSPETINRLNRYFSRLFIIQVSLSFLVGVFLLFYFMIDGTFSSAMGQTFWKLITFQIFLFPISLIAPLFGLKQKPAQENQLEYQESMEKLSKFEPQFRAIAKRILDDTKKPIIKIVASKTESTELWQSKFFGSPYFPIRMQDRYPLSHRGTPLRLVAQINLSDLPENKKLPTKGILQFFVSQDASFGLDFVTKSEEKRRTNYKVIYHEFVENDKSKLITDFSFIPQVNDHEDEWFPSTYEFALSFVKDEQTITMEDFHLDEFVSPDLQKATGYQYESLLQKFGVEYPVQSHQLFGYPNFTQSDPRRAEKNIQNYELLFQMVSQFDEQKKDWEILIGDVGIANFFIDPVDLEKLDFSKVFYSWDCS